MMRARAHLRGRWRWVALIVVAVGAAIAFAPWPVLAAAMEADTPVIVKTAQAPTSGFDPYLHRSNGQLADPINLVFRGGSEDQITTAVKGLLGWRSIRGSGMTFLDRGYRRGTGAQIGSGNGGTRQHLRLEGFAREGAREAYVLAAVHRDERVACGHVGRGYNESRDLVASAFAAAGYSVQYVQLGNTEASRHCDGSVNAGDGIVAVIDLNTRAVTP